MRRWWAFGLLGLMGCSLSQEKFIAKYAEAECALAFECYDAQLLEYYGWQAEEECVTERGGELTGYAVECPTYDPAIAKACLAAMKDVGCPAAGSDIDIPAGCEDVFTGCNAEDTDVQDTSTDTDL